MAGETVAVRSFHVAMHCTGCTTCRCNTHRLCLDATSIIWQYPPPPGWGNLTTLLLLFGCALYRVRYVSLQYPSPFFSLRVTTILWQYPPSPGWGTLAIRSLYVAVHCTGCVARPAIPNAFLCLDATTNMWQYLASAAWGSLPNVLLLFRRALYRVCCMSLQYPSPVFPYVA